MVAIDDIACYAGNGGSRSLMAAVAPASSPAFRVGSPRPSPTRGAADLDLTLGQPSHVRVDIFDLRGRLVRTALDESMPAGSHVLHWDGRTSNGGSAASGVYWMAIRAGAEERKLKLVVVR